MIEYVDTATVLAVVWRNFGNHAFRVQPGSPLWERLRRAEKLGWCRFMATDRAVLTRKGAEKAIPVSKTVVQ